MIQEIFAELKTAAHPVAKALHKGHDFKVLVMGFNKGMELKEHQAHIPTKVTVLDGSVVYHEGDKATTLVKYDTIDIPVNTPHSVTAVEDSLCLLTQG